MRLPEGATNQSLFFKLRSVSDGTAATGLAWNDVGAAASYTRSGEEAVTITLATLASASAVYSSGGFVEVHATKSPGVYRLDPPNAALVRGVPHVEIDLSGFSGVFSEGLLVELIDEESFMGHSNMRVRDEPDAVTGTRQLSIRVPKDERLMVLYIKNTTGSAIAALSIGSTASGTDIMNARPVAANEEFQYVVKGSTGRWAGLAEKIIYFTSPAWNSASLDVAVGISDLQGHPL